MTQFDFLASDRNYDYHEAHSFNHKTVTNSECVHERKICLCYHLGQNLGTPAYSPSYKCRSLLKQILRDKAM